MKMFMDYSSGGSLCVIFANVFKTKMEQGWWVLHSELSFMYMFIYMKRFETLKNQKEKFNKKYPECFCLNQTYNIHQYLNVVDVRFFQ